MVRILDPRYAENCYPDNEHWSQLDEFNRHYSLNEPIPAAVFPQTIIIDEPVPNMPDIFRLNFRVIVFSDRARRCLEQWAPDALEFVPVEIDIDTDAVPKSNLAQAYYYVNVLARAQRFQWLEMPTRAFQAAAAGVEQFVPSDDYSQWKLRPRAPGEPSIWREAWWHSAGKEYRGHFEILIDDDLWERINEAFPGQLVAVVVGAPPQSLEASGADTEKPAA